MIKNLHNTWGIAQYAVQDKFTCYESIARKLAMFTKEMYENNPEQTIETVFQLYRSINVVPIDYFTEQGIIDEIHKLASTKANAVNNNVISLGNNQGQAINRFLFPNMMTAEPKGRGSNSLRDRFFHDVKLKRAIKICFKYREGNNLVSPTALRRALELVTGENVQNFKPLNARVIAEHLCPVLWGTVYDYSAGYGGRLLGIATSNMRYNYTGIDPNTETFTNLNYLNDLLKEATGNAGTVINTVSEEYEPEARSVDLAFSSPPYFNLEKYCDEPTQCMVKYTDMDRWFDGYVAPTMQNIYKGLANNGIFATNIADYKSYGNKEFEVVDRWIATAEKIGFKHTGTIKMLLNTRPGVGNDKVAGREKWEGVYVFEKK